MIECESSLKLPNLNINSSQNEAVSNTGQFGLDVAVEIHDEVILEGPAETAQEAFDEVITCMQNPWCFGLEPTKVPLLVDGSYIHTNWYDAMWLRNLTRTFQLLANPNLISKSQSHDKNNYYFEL